MSTAAVTNSKTNDGTVTTTDSIETKPVPRRVISIDVYRGMVMTLMLLEMTHIEGFSHYLSEHSASDAMKRFWSFIHFHTSHVEWFGCSLHDLIQPGFSFLVGAALAFSIISRKQRGQTFGGMFLHAVVRSVILVCLGIFLRSLDNDHTDFTFDDTLTQIGLGYTFLFLIAWLPTAFQYVVLAILLIGYWGIFASYPVPGPEFDYAAVRVPADWEFHREGFQSHWNKNSNAAWAFDTVWMNMFPREKPFTAAGGGYATLSFIPTLGTMLLGLFAGTWLRTIQGTGARIGTFALAIVLCATIAVGVDYMGWCPIVKRIWTPTWTLYSGAFCFGFLLLFHLICDLWGFTSWSFPLRVIGANSIAAYVMSWTLVDWLKENWFRHFGWMLHGLSEPAQNALVGCLTFLMVWGILYWMYRRAIFLRI